MTKQSPQYYNADGPKAPLPWFGGKGVHARWILNYFPKEFTVYAEPFGGMANVLFRLKPGKVEIFNDLDERVINLFRVLRDKDAFEEFKRLVSLTPYSRKEFAAAIKSPEPEDSVERAWQFFIRCRQSLGGLGMSNITPSAWAVSLRSKRGMSESVSKYLSAIDHLEDVVERFRRVIIERRDALQFIDKYDRKDVLFYCDPPYLPETRYNKSAKIYRYEMSAEDHIVLLDRLRACQAKVLISGYPSDLYDRKLADWNRVSKVVTVSVGGPGRSRREVLWMNYDPAEKDV